MAVGDGLSADLPGRRIPGAEPAWTLADSSVRAQKQVGHHAGTPPPEDMPTILFLQECAPHVVEVMREQLSTALAARPSRLRAVQPRRRDRGPGGGLRGRGRRDRRLEQPMGPRLQRGRRDHRCSGPRVSPQRSWTLTLLSLPTGPPCGPPSPSPRCAPPPGRRAAGHCPLWLLEPHRAPRAYLTLGTIFGRKEPAAAAHEVAQTGCEVLLATGPGVDPSDLSDLPPSVESSFRKACVWAPRRTSSSTTEVQER